MPLIAKQRQQLKAQAHKLKPIVLIGNNGLTEAVSKEINRALNDHELLKIRIPIQDREERQAVFTEICQSVQAEPVQLIGNIGIVYRKNPQNKYLDPHRECAWHALHLHFLPPYNLCRLCPSSRGKPFNWLILPTLFHSDRNLMTDYHS